MTLWISDTLLQSVSRKSEAAVIAADDERIRATLAADIRALSALYAEDLVYVHASGVQG